MKPRLILYLKTVLISIGIILVPLFIWAIQTGKILNKNISHQFNGTIQEYKDDIITARGIFILENKEEPPQETVSVKIILDSNVNITRTILTLPTQDELKKTGGRFNTDTLKRVDSKADLATLQNDLAGGFAVGIVVKTAENIAGKSSFIARDINYRTVVKP